LLNGSSEACGASTNTAPLRAVALEAYLKASTAGLPLRWDV